MTDIVLLDGGLGQEINRRSSAPESHPLWSVKVMLEEPEIVKAVHRDYIDAGARVLTANTYTATPSRMAMHHYSDRFEEAQRMALKLIRETRDEAGSDCMIAGGLPPLVASYVASAAHDYAASLDEYRQIIALQKDAVDIFLIETIANLGEARAGVAAVREVGFAAYIGLTVADDGSNTLRSGESLEAALETLAEDGAAAVMLNCCFPEAIDAALPLLAASGLKFGGYANGFTSITPLYPGATVDDLTARKDLGPAAYADYVDRWIDAGATIIGGCCEIGPAHIRLLADRLKDQGHRLVTFG